VRAPVQVRGVLAKGCEPLVRMMCSTCGRRGNERRNAKRGWYPQDRDVPAANPARIMPPWTRPRPIPCSALAEEARAGIRREGPGVCRADRGSLPGAARGTGPGTSDDRAAGPGVSDLATALVPFWMSTKRIDDGDRWFAPRPSPSLRQRSPPGAGDIRPRLPRLLGGSLRPRGPSGSPRPELAPWTSAISNLVALALAGPRASPSAAIPRGGGRASVAKGSRPTEATPASEGRSSALHVLGVALQMAGDLEGARDVS
jgi:hypothetical protein